jgi:hypothetical protein
MSISTMKYTEPPRSLWPSMGAACFPRICVAFFSLFATGVVAEARDTHTVRGQGVAITVTCTESSVTLTDIEGATNGGQWVHFVQNGSSPLLSYSVNAPGPPYYQSNLSNVTCSKSGETVTISANSPEGLLSFSITLSPDGRNPVVIVSTMVEFVGATPTGFFRIKLPDLQSFALPGTIPMAMVPQMIGGVLPLAQVDTVGLGASVSPLLQRPTFGLPTTLNAMEIADVYDGGGSGGLFFTDLDGDYGLNIAPLQLNIANTGSTVTPVYEIAGYWTAVLKPHQWVSLPRLAVGVHSGDWHQAVDYHVKKRSTGWTFPDTPPWLREAGGIYMLGVAGGGSFFDTFPATPINDAYLGIENFACDSGLPHRRCLGDVLQDAQKLGSNVIYLTQWWRGHYNDQGDWIVDPVLGGAEALAKAVDDIHQPDGQHGRVILYLQPYTASQSSFLATSGQAAKWQAQPGYPIPSDVTRPAAICQWSPADCMAIPNTEWQDYIIRRAVSLVKDTHVDGFFLDTWGWEMNWPVQTPSEDVSYTSQEWSAAALRFVDRLRAAIRLENSEAVVLGENNASELQFHWDGGSSADLSIWNGNGPFFRQDGGLLWGSPIRYAMPNTNFFVNGSGVVNSSGVNTTPLGSVNQVIAAGHSLALGPYFLLDITKVGTVQNNGTETKPDWSDVTPSGPPDYSSTVSSYIKTLVGLRTTKYKDALVEGQQLPLVTASPGAPGIVAYLYRGSQSQVLTIVNNTGAAQPVTVTMHQGYGTASWTNALDPTSAPISGNDGIVNIVVSPAPASSGDPIGGLAILARPCDKYCEPPSKPRDVTRAVPLMTESFCPSTVCWSSGGGFNWTEWTPSARGPLPSDRWTWTLDGLSVSSPGVDSLFFYDSFGGGDFTYSGAVSFSPQASTPSAAGLSFRLSDRQRGDDAGDQGYDLIVTNVPLSTSGTVGLYKRPYALGVTSPLCSAPVNVTGAGASSDQVFHLSVTATTAWQQPTGIGGPNPPYPHYPQSTLFEVSVGVTLPDAIPPTVASANFSCTDNEPYLSGRFGAYASNIMSAGFACLQANEAPSLSFCPLPSPIKHPPPLQ